jgi:hypothetical protein
MGLFVLGAFLAAAPAAADEIDDILGSSAGQGDRLSIESTKWYFGLGAARAIVLNPKTINQTTSNDFAVFGIPDEFVVVNVAGKHNDSWDIQAILYRHLHALFDVGLAVDYHLEHKIDAEMQNAAIFGPDYVTSKDEIFTVIPTARFNTPWMGSTRFYLSGGVGWASVDRSNTAHYLFDLGGGEIAELEFSQDSRQDYATVAAGTGMEYSRRRLGGVQRKL